MKSIFQKIKSWICSHANSISESITSTSQCEKTVSGVYVGVWLDAYRMFYDTTWKVEVIRYDELGNTVDSFRGYLTRVYEETAVELEKTIRECVSNNSLDAVYNLDQKLCIYYD